MGKYGRVKPVGVEPCAITPDLLPTLVDNTTITASNLAHHPEHAVPDAGILGDGLRGQIVGAFLLPLVELLVLPFRVVGQVLLLELEVARTKAPDSFLRHKEASKTEDGTGIIPRIISRDIRAVVAELVQVSEDHRSTEAHAKRGPLKWREL